MRLNPSELFYVTKQADFRDLFLNKGEERGRDVGQFTGAVGGGVAGLLLPYLALMAARKKIPTGIANRFSPSTREFASDAAMELAVPASMLTGFAGGAVGAASGGRAGEAVGGMFKGARVGIITKQAMASAIGETAAYMTPGLGTALTARDAYRSFSKGNILGGLGHTALAGLSLIPGGGGIGAAIKGVKGMGKAIGTAGKAIGASKAVGAASRVAPTLSKAIGGGITGASNMVGSARKIAPTMATAVGSGFSRATEMGRKAVNAFDNSKAVTAINKLPGVRHIQASPKTSLVGGMGAVIGGDMRQAGRESAINQTADVFNSLRGSMPTVNPLSAMPGNKPLIGSVFGG